MGSACGIIAIVVANLPIIFPGKHFVILKTKKTFFLKTKKTRFTGILLLNTSVHVMDVYVCFIRGFKLGRACGRRAVGARVAGGQAGGQASHGRSVWWFIACASRSRRGQPVISSL